MPHTHSAAKFCRLFLQTSTSQSVVTQWKTFSNENDAHLTTYLPTKKNHSLTTEYPQTRGCVIIIIIKFVYKFSAQRECRHIWSMNGVPLEVGRRDMLPTWKFFVSSAMAFHYCKLLFLLPAPLWSLVYNNIKKR